LDVETLIELLEYRAAETPDKTAFTFDERPCTFRQMWEAVNRFAAYLLTLGINPGDRVVVVLPNSHEFFFAFYGVQRTGAIAVPVFPGLGPPHILSMARLCQARAVVIPSSTPDGQLVAFREQAASQSLAVVTVSGSDSHSTTADFPRVSPDDVAFIQYTSGSTGDPKGVQLSHQNLLTNAKQMIAGMEITTDDVFVSWLPVYHDMGLILMTIVPFFLAVDLFLLPTSLRNIRSWVDTIQQRRGTFTAAPDFAYRLCVRHIRNPADYDITSLRVALNAAEPVRAQTVAEFEGAFGLENVMTAGYGLAEATVGVSMWPPQTPIKIGQWGHVSVGPPFPEIDLQIVQDGRVLGPGEIGEIMVSSPANSRGYYDNPEATQALFWQPGYIVTGDLGYVDEEGHLFIVARKKNTIIHAGRTLYPGEIQELVETLPAVRYSAAVGIDRGGIEGEQVYVFAEIRGAGAMAEDKLHATVLQIVDGFHDRFGLRPGRVYLVKPKAIPMTHNGKIQHARLKQLYLEGSLREAGQLVYPEY
jgi:acyl-CoA synthetase (AMP-forming)/AMP-acid ligase II